MRPDGTRVRDLTAIMQALPYVMPKRYDAQNWAEENLDEDAIRDYIRAKRREGRTVTHMSLLVSAYYRAVLKNPKINYFVMNRRIYKRNHFCFSFVILKTRADGTPNTNFANRSVSLLCRTFWFFSMVERIFSVTVNTVSSGSRYTFREVSSGVPSARVFRITKLKQKWFRL